MTGSPKPLREESKSTLLKGTDPNRGQPSGVRPRGFPELPAGWISEWETFPSADQSLQLFGVLHRLEKGWEGKNLLVVAHGFGEHGGRYLHFPHYLQGAVDGVYCIDHRGHGRSEGLRGHVDRFDLYCEDLILAIRRLEEMLLKRFGIVHLHLFGHSMGGLIALRAAHLDSSLPIRSLALSAPLLGIKAEVPFAKKLLAGTLSKLWGSLQLESELDVGDLSHDPEVVQSYTLDRLVCSKITPRLFTQMQWAIQDTVPRSTGLHFPTQMMIPGEDRITDSEATLAYFRALKQKDKQLKTYPGFFHESFNEIGKEKAFEDLKTWIQRN